MEKNCLIEALAFGGDGIARVDGQVVFVPFTASGDQALISIAHTTKSFSRGSLVSLTKPSPERQIPPCRHYMTCGGCQLQHINYNAQVAAKGLWLKDALQRIAKIDLQILNHFNFDVEPARSIFCYRRHVTFHLQAIKNKVGFLLGYMASDNKTLVPLKECLLFDFPPELSLESLIEFSSKLQADRSHTGRLKVMRNEKGECLLGLHFEVLPKNCMNVAKDFMKNCKVIKGILLQGRQKRQVLGEPFFEEECLGLKLKCSLSAFLQNNREQSEKLYSDLLKSIKQLNPTSVLDLYSGIGVTSLLLAKEGISVKAVELNPQAVNLANENQKRLGLSKVFFVASDVLQELKPLTKAPNVMIVNPPRTGIDPESLGKMIELHPKEIFYISCMPATLARDLKAFLNAGYQIKMIKAYDMFPQTTHLETLVHLQSSSNS